jgi:hypothetical protein
MKITVMKKINNITATGVVYRMGINTRVIF